MWQKKGYLKIQVAFSLLIVNNYIMFKAQRAITLPSILTIS